MSARLYGRYVAASVRSQLQYRASTAFFVLGQFVTTGVDFVAVWVLFERFGHVLGWTLSEVALLYGMANVSFSLAEAAGRGFDRFGDEVRTGGFDRVLLRPRSAAFQVAASQLQLSRAGRLLQAAAVLGYAIQAIERPWSWLDHSLLAAAIVGGFCLFLGVLILQATFSFWSVEGLEIFATVTYGGVETVQYPLSIYDRWLRNLFLYAVPLGCANYFPGLVLLGRPDRLGSPEWLPWVSPLVGVAFLGLALSAWRIGVRHYRSTGS